MGNFDIDKAVRSTRRMMQIIGTWPEQSPSVVYKITGISTMFLMSASIVTVLIQVFKNFADLPSASFGICCSLAGFHNVVKHSILFCSKPKFCRILDSLKEPILASHEDHLDIYLKNKIRLCNLWRSTLIITVLVTGIIIILSPIFDASSERPLPFPFFMDLGRQNLGVYYSIWFFQAAAVLLVCWSVTSFDGLIFTFIVIAAGQLKILRKRIVHAADCYTSKPSSLRTQEYYDSEINGLLKKCVKHHLAIERYIATIEETFTMEFLVQLIISLLKICVIGFNFILLPVASLDFGRCLLFFSTAVIEIAFFCIPGNEIILQSEKIRDACYMSEWANCSPSVRKTLFIIMERSKRPLCLTAARFVNLSLETLVNVLKSAFSYFTVLMQLYAKSK